MRSPASRARFTHGLHDEQVFVLVQQRDRTLRAEIHIGLVNNDHAVCVVLQQVFERIERQAAPVGAFGLGSTTPPFGLS